MCVSFVLGYIIKERTRENRMKKIAIGILLAALVLLILIFVGVGLFLDGAVIRGVETIGSRLTRVTVKLQAASLSLLSGTGTLEGLVVGNPAGYKSPSAISIGTAHLEVAPSSLFSSKVIVKSIRIQSPQLTFETDLRANNLSQILANLHETAGSGKKESAEPQAAKPGKRLEVDDFLIAGGKVQLSLNALGGQSATVDLPEIHLQNLGRNAEGITSAELTQQVLQIVIQDASAAAVKALPQLTKGALSLTNALPASALGDAEKISKGLGGLLKPKK